MTCLSEAQLAAAASGEDPAAVRHAAGCAACTAALARERQTRELIQGSPDVALAAPRRIAMRAELLAACDAQPVVSRRSLGWGRTVAVVAAAAAAVWILIFAGSPRTPRPSAPDPAVVAVARSSAGSAPAPAPAVASAAEVVASIDVESTGARFERTGDVVRVTEGALVLSTQGRPATEVVAGAARVAVADARVRVNVHHGQLVQVQVFAGAAELTAAGRTQILATGEIWRAPADPRPSPPRADLRPAPSPATTADAGPAPSPRPAVSHAPPVAPRPAPTRAIVAVPAPPAPELPRRSSAAVRAFQIGWEALRDSRYADAILAFDRATDPSVVEDARYWAAVAAARAGLAPDAQARLRAFLKEFPGSPHAAQARAALLR